MAELGYMPPKPITMLVTLPQCIRCGGTHTDLTVKRFCVPQDEYEFWGMCPVTNEPVIIAVLDKETTSR